MPRLPRFPRGRDIWSWPPLAALLLLGTVLLTLSATRVVIRERTIARERQALEARVRTLEAEIGRLRRAVAASASPEAIERQAKEQLGLKRPGEEVVVIVPERASTSTPAGRSLTRFLPEWLRHLVTFFAR